MTAEQQKAFEAACTEHLKSGGDAVSEAAFQSGWQAAIDHFKQHMQSPEMVERVENAIYDGAIPLHEVRELAEKDGYMVAKGVVKQSHKRAKAAIAAITEG